MAALRISWQFSDLRGRLRLHGLHGYPPNHSAWIIYDIGESQTTKMDEDLAKEFFTFTDADLRESAMKAKQR